MATFFTNNWKELTAFGAILVVFGFVMKFYLKQTVNQQVEVTNINAKIFDLFTNEIKKLSEDSYDNKKLNKDQLVIQAQMQKVLLEHDKYSRDSWERITKLLNEMCELMNGGNPAIRKLQDDIIRIQERMNSN